MTFSSIACEFSRPEMKCLALPLGLHSLHR